jgi:hypothetical protein
MSKPPQFSGFKQLVQTLADVQNKIVREEFSDVSELDIDDLGKPRSALREACLIDREEKSIQAIIVQMLFFYIVMRKARDFQQPYYGIPIGTDEAQRKYKPQIELVFAQDLDDVEEDEIRVWGSISFRLMSETSTTITKTEVERLAREVKRAFSTGSGYLWKKGKDMATYTDWSKGYQLQLLCFSKQDAKDLVQEVLSIQNHQADWKNFQYKVNEEPNEAYPMVRDRVTILGKQHREPRRRPVETVRFQYAVLKLHGKMKPIPLVDRSGTFYDPTV